MVLTKTILNIQHLEWLKKWIVCRLSVFKFCILKIITQHNKIKYSKYIVSNINIWQMMHTIHANWIDNLFQHLLKVNRWENYKKKCARCKAEARVKKIEQFRHSYAHFILEMQVRDLIWYRWIYWRNMKNKIRTNRTLISQIVQSFETQTTAANHTRSTTG